jgi:hemolysin activation/secretion protein
MWGPLSRLALTIVVAGLPLAAAAQGVPSTALPGREREQFQDITPPLSRPTGPAVTLPSTEPPAGAATIKVTLRGVTVVGSTVYSHEQLAALYGDLIGREVSLTEIYDLAKKITARYGSDGYVLSRAIVPPQNFNRAGADIKIQAIEGYVDQVVWPDRLSRYRDFFSDYTARILADRPANVRTLERYLLLAGDLPGLKFSTKLRPSAKNTGASTLVVEVTEKPFDAAARVDNRGSKARGPYQYLVTGTANNLIGAHEAFTLTYGGTFQFKELQFGAAAYRQVLNSEGLTAFANVSYGAGKPDLGAELDSLAFKTRSLVFEGGLSYPVIRTRERNLILTGLMFASNSEGIMLDAPYTDDRLRGFRLRADFDMADSWRGINRFSATYSKGIHGLGSTDNGSLLASVAAGRVDFSKVEFSASRVQPLGAGFSLSVAAETQYALTTLLAPEQCSFGGRNIGRAFDPSELTGDHCWMGSAELRYDLPLGGLPKDQADAFKYLKQSQIYTFLDRGEAYRREPAVGTPETQTGTSAGVGLRLGWMDNALLDLSAAKAVAGPRDDWRFFFIATVKN